MPDQHLLHVRVLELLIPLDQLLALILLRSGAGFAHLGFRPSGNILAYLVFHRVLLVMNFD